MDGTDGIGLGTDGRNYTAYHGYWPRDLSKPEALSRAQQWYASTHHPDWPDMSRA